MDHYCEGHNSKEESDASYTEAKLDYKVSGTLAAVTTASPSDQVTSEKLVSIPTKAFVLKRQAVVRFVQDSIAESLDKQKENSDKRGRKNHYLFKIGDKVLLSTTNLPAHVVTNVGSSKLLPRFIGPFKVLHRKGVAYTLNTHSAMRLHPTFYVGRLKPYRNADAYEEDGCEPPGSRATSPRESRAHACNPQASSRTLPYARRMNSPALGRADSEHSSRSEVERDSAVPSYHSRAPSRELSSRNCQRRGGDSPSRLQWHTPSPPLWLIGKGIPASLWSVSWAVKVLRSHNGSTWCAGLVIHQAQILGSLESTCSRTFRILSMSMMRGITLRSILDL